MNPSNVGHVHEATFHNSGTSKDGKIAVGKLPVSATVTVYVTNSLSIFINAARTSSHLRCTAPPPHGYPHRHLRTWVQAWDHWEGGRRFQPGPRSGTSPACRSRGPAGHKQHSTVCAYRRRCRLKSCSTRHGDTCRAASIRCVGGARPAEPTGQPCAHRRGRGGHFYRQWHHTAGTWGCQGGHPERGDGTVRRIRCNRVGSGERSDSCTSLSHFVRMTHMHICRALCKERSISCVL